MDLIGERWSMSLIRELLLGPRRFSDLKPFIGLAQCGFSLLPFRNFGGKKR